MLQSYLESLIKNTETKPFLATSEFIVFVLSEVAVLAEWLPTSNANLKSLLAIIAAGAYKLSRGLAKAGVKPTPPTP